MAYQDTYKFDPFHILRQLSELDVNSPKSNEEKAQTKASPSWPSAGKVTGQAVPLQGGPIPGLPEPKRPALVFKSTVVTPKDSAKLKSVQALAIGEAIKLQGSTYYRLAEDIWIDFRKGFYKVHRNDAYFPSPYTQGELLPEGTSLTITL